jgi:hypothetical protein
LNEVNDQDDDGNYEQEVDQAAANVADEAKKPENDQDNNYSPEHGVFLSVNLNFRRRIYSEVHLLAKLDLTSHLIPPVRLHRKAQM